MAGDGSLAADALSQVWQLPHHAQVVLRVYTKGCLSRDLGPDGCLRAITQVFRFPDTLSLWQYACVRTLVRWTAYRGTLLSLLEYAAQRTTVIPPNVLLYSSPTYWHLDGALRNRRVSVQRLDLRLLNNHALKAHTVIVFASI